MVYNENLTATADGPSLARLQQQQESVQLGKHRERTLEAYDTYVFPDADSIYAVRTEVSDFIAGQVPSAVSFASLLHGMAEQRQGGRLCWAEMAGGKAIAMRQAASLLDGAES